MFKITNLIFRTRKGGSLTSLPNSQSTPFLSQNIRNTRFTSKTLRFVIIRKLYTHTYIYLYLYSNYNKENHPAKAV